MSRNLNQGILSSDFLYRDHQTDLIDSSLLRLLLRRQSRNYQIDSNFLNKYAAMSKTGLKSFIRDIEKIILHRSWQNIVSCETLTECLDQYFKNFNFSDGVAIALSGGLDSMVLLNYLLCKGVEVRPYSLRTGLAGYCESVEIAHFALEKAIQVQFIDFTADDFVKVLPAFLQTTETPIYNLHAVSKWLLAQEMRTRGEKLLVSGDGADQVMRGQNECDLYPLTQKSFSANQVQLLTPFAGAESLQFVKTHGPWSDKAPIRQLAKEFDIHVSAKKASYFPQTRFFDSCLEYSVHLLKSYFSEKGVQACVASQGSLMLEA